MAARACASPFNDAEAREGFERSKSEAASCFGDDRIFIEKFVTEPRHIEIQLIGDQHGNVLWLNERECSIQRRNQKVIEEAPSPFLDAATRKAMGEQAVALAKAVGYTSAGTVEFIVDKDRNFYFLEMNTRLQVEHPVTELITGLDLVELMLRAAAGEKLPLTQDEVKLNGWAIESRHLCRGSVPQFPALDRPADPLPPARRKTSSRCRSSATIPASRGGEISTFYDPMIAKLCTWAPTRIEAIDAMRDALDEFEVEGVGNNIPFLSAVMAQERFRAGRLTTGYIAEEFPDGFSGVELDPESLTHLAALACCSAFALESRGFADGTTLNMHHTENNRAVLIGSNAGISPSAPTASSTGSPPRTARSSSSKPAGNRACRSASAASMAISTRSASTASPAASACAIAAPISSPRSSSPASPT